MTDFEKVLMDRDRMTRSEAKMEKQSASTELYDMVERGCSYGEIEDMLIDEYGLEMDYLLDLI